MLTKVHKTKWFLPLFSLALGGAMLAAFWIGGNPEDGLAALAVMAGFGLVILLGGRSETVRGLRGDGRDERFAWIDRTATLIAGQVLLAAVLFMCLWEWAHGRDGTPYVPLGALTGVVYMAAVAVLRLRG
jgi:hypothetical protein